LATQAARLQGLERYSSEIIHLASSDVGQVKIGAHARTQARGLPRKLGKDFDRVARGIDHRAYLDYSRAVTVRGTYGLGRHDAYHRSRPDSSQKSFRQGHTDAQR